MRGWLLQLPSTPDNIVFFSQWRFHYFTAAPTELSNSLSLSQTLTGAGAVSPCKYYPFATIEACSYCHNTDTVQYNENHFRGIADWNEQNNSQYLISESTVV